MSGKPRLASNRKRSSQSKRGESDGLYEGRRCRSRDRFGCRSRDRFGDRFDDRFGSRWRDGFDDRFGDRFGGGCRSRCGCRSRSQNSASKV